MRKKDFIRDGGKVRGCTSNIAKMNVFEWIYYRRNTIFNNVIDSIKVFGEGVCMVVFSIVNFAILIAFPVTLLIAAWWQIRKARKEMIQSDKSVLRNV